MNSVLTLVLSSILVVGLTISESTVKNVSVEKSAAPQSREDISVRDKRTPKVLNDDIFKNSDVYERRLSNVPRNEENIATDSWSSFHYSDPEANLYKPENIDVDRRLKMRNRNPVRPTAFSKIPRSGHDDIFDKDEITDLFKTAHFDYGKFVKKHQKDILSGNNDNLKNHNVHSSKTRENKKTFKPKNRGKEIQTYDFGNFQKQPAPEYEEIFKTTTGKQIKDNEHFKNSFENEDFKGFGNLKNSYGDLIGQEMNVDSGKSEQDLQNNHATNYGFSFEIKHAGNPSTSSNSFGSYSSPEIKKTKKYLTPILKEKNRTPYPSEFETQKSTFTSTTTFQPNVSPDSFKTTYGTPNWNDYTDNQYVSLFDNQGNPISSPPSLINSPPKLLKSQYSTMEWNDELANTFKPTFDNKDVSLSSTPATLQENMGNNWSFIGNNGFTPILSKDLFKNQPSKDIFQIQPSNNNVLLNQASDNDLFQNQHLNGIFQNQNAKGGFQNKPTDIFDGNAGMSQGHRDSFNSGFGGSNYFNLKDSPKNNLVQFDEFKPSVSTRQSIYVHYVHCTQYTGRYSINLVFSQSLSINTDS